MRLGRDASQSSNCYERFMKLLMILAALFLCPQAADARSIITPDGVKLHYDVFGKGGGVVIYVHGGPGSNFRGQERAMQLATRGRMLVVYDQRGSGRSTVIKDAKRLTLDEHIGDLEALRRHLGARRISIVALSWGAAIATSYAAEHPGRVTRMVLISPISPTRVAFEQRLRALDSELTDEVKRRRSELRAKFAAAPDAELPAICREVVRLTIGLQYVARPTPKKISEAARRCDIPPAAIRNRPIVEFAGLASLGEWDLRPQMRRIDVPVLVLEGAASHVPRDPTREWAINLPYSRLLLIPHAGHELFLDEPIQFSRAVRTFLGGRFPRSAQQLTSH